jgi:hypothetical protein
MKNNSSFEHNKILLFRVFGINLVFAILWKTFDIFDIDTASDILLMVFLLVLFASGIYISVSLYEMCPSCYALFGAVKDTEKTELLSQDRRFRNRTKTQEVKNAQGEKIGTTDVNYQVQVQISVYRYYYHCKVCSHTWAKEHKEEKQI